MDTIIQASQQADEWKERYLEIKGVRPGFLQKKFEWVYCIEIKEIKL